VPVAVAYDGNLDPPRQEQLMDPSTDEQQALHLDFNYPDAERDLNR
jgi:hypothetical protein